MPSAHGNGHANGSGNGHGRPIIPAFPNGHGSDRLPPQNLEAEQGVLGSILLDNEVLHEIIPILKAEHFYRDSHQILYRAIRDLYDQAKAIDSITLEEELKRRDELEKAGGLDAIFDIQGKVAHSANFRLYTQIVREKAVARELIQAANEILGESYSNSYSAEDLLSAAERRVFAIAEDQISGDTIELKEIMTDAMTRIANRVGTDHTLMGLGSGYAELDELTNGFQGSQLIIVAARPSMGKTAFALNLCEHSVLELQSGVMFVSLEMGNVELAERLICTRAQVDGHKMKTGRLATKDMKDLGIAYEAFRSGAPLMIDDTPARNMLQITANARRLKLRQGIKMIVVDYIQLIDAEEQRDSRQEQIAKISRRLKTLARELDLPVIALSQLNRAVESREDRRPRMADLRESGAIEQDADMVLLLHRPEYYDPNDQPGVAEIIVAKNRNGATGSVKLQFQKNFMRFSPLSNLMEPLGGGYD
jgi:replicative DNA helicase